MIPRRVKIIRRREQTTRPCSSRGTGVRQTFTESLISCVADQGVKQHLGKSSGRPTLGESQNAGTVSSLHSVSIHVVGIIGLVVIGLFVLTTTVRTWSFALDGPRDAALVPLALLVAILVQGLAESRLLIEIGWTLLVIVAVRTATNRWERR